MNIDQFSKLFPLGSHLCREPMPAMSEMKQDMENLKKHGFNLIKLQEHWMVDEPEEGKFDFSKYEELIEHAAKLDMGVYLGLTCEQAPHWLYEKYPDCRMVGRNGQPIFYEAQTTLPADGKPGPCYDHPGAQDAQRNFISELVKILGKHENVVVWNVWQEIAYWSAGIVGQEVCYCANTLSFFRQWLKEFFGDLDNLNHSWKTRYPDWDSIQPDRRIKAYPIPQATYWEYFMHNIQITAVLKQRLKVIKENDPLHRPVFAHRGAPEIGSGADWSYAENLDFLGSSTYPAWGSTMWEDSSPTAGHPADRHQSLLSELYHGIVLRFDHLRASNGSDKPLWAAEFQGGPVSGLFHKGRTPSGNDIRRWMMGAIASGVSAISFWVTRAEIMAAEANGFSLVDSEGDTTERYEETSRIGNALNQYPELFNQPNLQPGSVAILVNEWNYRVLQTDPGQKALRHLLFSLQGWHRLLWESGIQTDFINIDQLDQSIEQQYKVLILPVPFTLAETQAEKLKEFVKHGGCLIAEACPGRYTENLVCNRGELSPIMKELFSVTHKNLTHIREPKHGTRWTEAERTWGIYQDPPILTGCGMFDGYSLQSNVFLETFNCVDSEPVFVHNEHVTATLRKYGKGAAYLLGTFVGHNGLAYRNKDTWSTILHLLKTAGVEPDHRGKLIVRKRKTGTKEAWIIMNPTEQDLTEEFSIAGYISAEDLLGAEIIMQDNTVTLTVESLDIRVLIVQ